MPWYRRPALLVPLGLVLLVVVAVAAVAGGEDEPVRERPTAQDRPDDGDDPDPGASPAEDPLTAIPEGRAALGIETSSFTVALTWENEVDDEADPPEFGQGQEGATGLAVLRLASDHGLICADITVDGLSEDDTFEDGPGAHLHQGGPAENGPIAVSFTAPDAETGQSSGCFTEFEEGFDPAETLAMLEEHPEDWYVNVHSRAFPAGLVRGQLPDGGQEPPAPE